MPAAAAAGSIAASAPVPQSGGRRSCFRPPPSPSYDPRGVGGGGGIAVGEGAVWVTDGRRNALIRYEPKSGRITRIPLDAAPADVAVGHGLVWVTLRTTG